MEDEFDSVEKKVAAIFVEFASNRASRLDGSRSAEEARNAFAAALSADGDLETARDIAFHLTDWNWEAAFLTAVHLFPERFSDAELRAGADMVLVHAPNHLAAAAILSNHPIQDVFDVGVAENSE